ncbi:MAG: hypothetical protein GY940_05045, partial [bacterium]|nr:hypothetical protein [bacterium]
MKLNKPVTIISRLTIYILIIITAAIISCGNPAKTPKGETQIVIFHINDVHAKIDNYPKIAWIVAEERKKNPHVFLMNAGDNFSGNPIVDMVEPKGEPVRVLMNHTGYDVMALGNHEFDYGQEVLRNFMQTATYPILCANVKVGKSGIIPQPEPFKILQTANGIKIAVLGLIQVEKSNGIPSTHPNNIVGLSFTDPLEVAPKYRYLRKENHVFIALTHVGLRNETKLAEQMGELDLVVGGHSHTVIREPQETNGVLITQAGGQAQYLGRIDLLVKDGKVVKKSGRLIPLASFKNEIPKLKEMVNKFNDNPLMDQVFAEIPRPLFNRMELGNLITDGLRKVHRLDIAFHNSGGIRSSHLKRRITLKDIYTLHPFSNRLVRFQMTPAEIRSLLTYDYERSKRLGLKVSGIHYTVTRTRDFKVKEIKLEDPEGKLLDETKTYAVGMNDYIASSFSFSHEDPGQSLEVTLAENLARYLKEWQDVTSGTRRHRAFEVFAVDNEMESIGKTTVVISGGSEIYPGSTSAGNLAADAVRNATGADIATYPTNQVNSGLAIPASSPYYKEYTPGLYRFSNTNKVVKASISGKDLRTFLLARSHRAGGADLQVSGMTYAILFNPAGDVEAVKCVLPDGKEMDDSTRYNVAFSQFDYKKYYNLEDKVTNPSDSEKTIEQMINDYNKSNPARPGSIDEERINIKGERDDIQPKENRMKDEGIMAQLF